MIDESRKRIARSLVGTVMDIKIDRPLGSKHPKYPDIVYPLNYGYIPDILGGDGEEFDVYLLGVDHPLKEYRARIIGVVYRHNDTEDKLIAVPCGSHFSEDEIRSQIDFQERFFQSEIELMK